MVETNLINKSNIYDKLLITFIVLQIFGGFGGTFQPVRIFVVFFIPSMLLYFATNKNILKEYTYIRNVFFIWILYGLVSLLYAIIPEDSIKELLYLILNFLAFFVFVYFANKADNPTESIIKGWIILFVLTIPIAFYEFLYDKHFALSVQSENLTLNYGFDIIERKFASVTFGNLNTYNTMLMFMFPFVIGQLINVTKNKYKNIKIILVITLSLIVIMNGSRGAVIGLLIGFSVYLLKILKRKGTFAMIFISILFFGYFSYKYLGDLFWLITERFITQGLEDEGRANLITSSYDALLNSYLMGIGAGNFKPMMENYYKLEIAAPHNFFLEILIQYGLFIFALFIGFIIKIIRNVIKNKNTINKFIVITALCMFPVTTIINSSYILSIWIWIFIASLYVLAESKYGAIRN